MTQPQNLRDLNSQSYHPEALSNLQCETAEISIILPTLRPSLARICVDRIEQTSAGINYEIIVVSPFDMNAELSGCRGLGRVKFVREADRAGVCRAYEAGLAVAEGTYIFGISDDHLFARNCLRNLLSFMRGHGDTLFVAGPRRFGDHGPGSEWRVYGRYYAFLPCIRRDRIAEIGGFYDPYYRSYWGDPDLALRVWYHGGTVALCPDAWVEYFNEWDDVARSSASRYAERDQAAFVARWHKLYGDAVKSERFEHINVEHFGVAPGLPPERASRLIVYLRQNEPDLFSFEQELDQGDGLFASPLIIPALIEEATRPERFVALSVRLRTKFGIWLTGQLIGDAPCSTVRGRTWAADELDALFSAFQRDLNRVQTADSSDPSAIGRSLTYRCAAALANFISSQHGRSDPVLIYGGYHYVNLIYDKGYYHSWPQEFGGFTQYDFNRREGGRAVRAETFAGLVAAVNAALRAQPEPYRASTEVLADPIELERFEQHFTCDGDPVDPEVVFAQCPPQDLLGPGLTIIGLLARRDWMELDRLLEGDKPVEIPRESLRLICRGLLRQRAAMPRTTLFRMAIAILRAVVTQRPDYTIDSPRFALEDVFWCGERLKMNKAFDALPEPLQHALSALSTRPFVIESIDGHNIVYYGGRYYAISEKLGAVFPWQIINEKFLSSASYLVLRNAIAKRLTPIVGDALGEDLSLDPDNYIAYPAYIPQLLVGDYEGYDIYRCGAKFIGWPTAAGALDVRVMLGPNAPSWVEAETPFLLKSKIDGMVGRPVSAYDHGLCWITLQRDQLLHVFGHQFDDSDSPLSDLTTLLIGYRRYNIIFNAGMYFGWSWNDGGFTVDRFLNVNSPDRVIGTSVREVKDQIDLRLGPLSPTEEASHDWAAVIEKEEVCENRYRAARAARRGSLIVDGKPTYVIASTAFGCNIECTMCYLLGEDQLAYEGPYGRREMSEETYLRVQQLLPTAETLLMTVEGEILVHSKWLSRWLEMSRERPSLKISFQSNGMLLNKRVVDRLFDYPNMEHIGISIDGATPEVNDAIRVRSKVEVIYRNINYLVGERLRRGLTHPTVHVHFVMMRDNIHELPLLVEKLARLGIQGMSAGYLIARRREDIQHSLYFDQARSDRYLTEARRIAGGYNFPVNFPISFAQANLAGRTRRNPCYDPWKHGQILHDGTIYPCCNNVVKMGNINDPGGFDAVWNSERYQKMRATINTENPYFTDCKYCYALMPPNNFECHIDTHLLFKLLEEGVLENWVPGLYKLLVDVGEQMVN